jgi:hypothetical protein
VVVSRCRLAREAQPSRVAEEPDRSRSWLLRNRFSDKELQAMIDLYRSGAPARMAAERYGVGVRSAGSVTFRRLLRENKACRTPRSAQLRVPVG